MVTPLAQLFRNDVAVVGPLSGENTFVLAATLGSDPSLYLLTFFQSQQSRYRYLRGGLYSYLTGHAPDGYALHYFKYRMALPDNNQTVNDHRYKFDVYQNPEATTPVQVDGVNATLSYREGLAAPTLTPGGSFLALTEEPHNYAVTSNLLAGVKYTYVSPRDQNIPFVEFVGSSGVAEGDYGGLPTGVGTSVTQSQFTFYLLPLNWVMASACSSPVGKGSLIYHQCARSKALIPEPELQQMKYFINYCQPSETGFTRVADCKASSGHLYYYASSAGGCGRPWGSGIGMVGMDGKLVTATSPYGYSNQGFCYFDGSAFVPSQPGASGQDYGWLWLSVFYFIIVAVIVFLIVHFTSGKREARYYGQVV